MFGLTFEKLLIIGVVAAFIIGPQRLPAYAAKLAALITALRSFVDMTKTRVAKGIGPEFDEIDWKTLDPRQYDPRRIIQDAMADDPGDLTETLTSARSQPSRISTDGAAPTVGTAPTARFQATVGRQHCLLA